MNYGYIRSRDMGKIDEMKDTIKEQVKCLGFSIDKFFIDEAGSGLSVGDKFLAMMNQVEKTDCIFVTDISRISRNQGIVVDIVKRLQDKDVRLYVDGKCFAYEKLLDGVIDR